MYYGLVATASADTDAHGHARFDDASCYEIRCFVRRHDPRCPRTGERNDCKGELVWSEPTEIYRIASHFDLDGTSNRPVTIQLPDIPALTAQAAALPVKGPQRGRLAIADSRGPRGGTKQEQFLTLVIARYGPLTEFDIKAVSRAAAELAPEAELHPGTARKILRAQVLAARNGDCQ